MTASIDLLRARLEEERPQVADLEPEAALLALVEVTGRLATTLSHRGFGGPEAALGQERALSVAVYGLWLHELLAPVEAEIVEEAAEVVTEDVPSDVTPTEPVEPEMFPAPKPRRWAEQPRGPVAEIVDDEAFWSSERWRELLARHGVRVADAVRQAQEIAANLPDLPPAPTSLDIRHPGVAAHLRVWVEAQAKTEAS